MKRFMAVVLLCAAVPAWAADIFTFTLLPADGQLSGTPGETIGWGYALDNQSTSLWLVTTGVAPGAFQYGTPNLLFDFPILAPSTSVTVPFDAATSTGLLALTWDATAPFGAVEAGSFLLSAEWWNGDPFAGGQLAFAASPASQDYDATVAAPVPEPGTGALLAVALLATGTVAARRRRRQAGAGRPA